MADYDCMTPDELTLWTKTSPYAPAKVPCTDCPLWFATLAREQGKCCGTPGARSGTRPLRPDAHHGTRYATDEERREARRETWRVYKSRLRARQSAQ